MTNANTLLQVLQVDAGKKINRPGTYSNIRARYSTVRAFCEDAKTSSAFLALCLTGQRGKRPGSKGQKLLERLVDEGLLVVEGAAS